jgi:hypothetical protein
MFPLRVGSVFLAVSLVAVIGSAELSAQQPLVATALDSGLVVRLRLRSGGPIAARLLASLTPASDSIIFCRYATPACRPLIVRPAVLSVRDVLGVDVRAGSRAARGALIGGAIGVALGLGFGVLRSEVGSSEQGFPPELFFVAYAIGGVTIGAIVGSTVKVWRPVQ